MKPFTSYNNDPLYIAAQAILEKVMIAPPKGYNANVAPNIEKVLRSVIDAAAKKTKITAAQFFDNSTSGGVAFSVGRGEYALSYKPTRMGSDDIVRGTLTLQKTGEYKELLLIKGPDSMNAEFPTKADVTKMVAAIANLAKGISEDAIVEEDESIVEAKEYFMLVQRKYPEFKVLHYSKGRMDVRSKGVPQKFTRDSADKALIKFDHYGDYTAVPWVEK